jgi:hypothetical protein
MQASILQILCFFVDLILYLAIECYRARLRAYLEQARIVTERSVSAFTAPLEVILFKP